jgi:hypothetical protein
LVAGGLEVEGAAVTELEFVLTFEGMDEVEGIGPDKDFPVPNDDEEEEEEEDDGRDRATTGRSSSSSLEDDIAVCLGRDAAIDAADVGRAITGISSSSV